MIAHADSTRDQPGLFDGPMTQLLGLGKTFFRLTRAGVSATAAALSLRVSVASQVAAAQLAVDHEVEHGMVALSALNAGSYGSTARIWSGAAA